MRGQLGVDKAAELQIDSRQDFGQLLNLGDPQAAGRQGFGHLQAHIAGTNDDGAGRGCRLQGLHDREGVAHGVQQVDAICWTQGIRSSQTGDRRADGHGTSAYDQAVVGDQLVLAVRA